MAFIPSETTFTIRARHGLLHVDPTKLAATSKESSFDHLHARIDVLVEFQSIFMRMNHHAAKEMDAGEWPSFHQ
jgi:hypothetical protein